jgi:hypothetical protein
MNSIDQYLNIFILISGLAFVCYGSLVLFAGGMLEEFKRYNLSRYRMLVGFLEVVGGVGSLIGIFYPFILIISSAGLSILMLLGIAVRLFIRDTFLHILPAFILMLVNLYILSRTILTLM